MKSKKLLFLVIFSMNILSADLVNILEIVPDVVLDIRYATENNFTGKVVYPNANCFLERVVACALAEVQKELAPLGLRLKIWDGYRPLSVQRIFWNIMPDARYVMPPEKGSRHNRGCAVDLTLVDAHGNELPMGSEFDDFSQRAHRDFSGLTTVEAANRILLETKMLKHGFTGVSWEWWHYDFKGWEKYPIQDVQV
ncbi:MAG TPA: D-alanyl-D-alanine dipeptidase [Candidatus Babeliales bacterium]|nr:D-alanyl-D-alanine dipeptidase [Candidatus Babeliales bacterium]